MPRTKKNRLRRQFHNPSFQSVQIIRVAECILSLQWERASRVASPLVLCIKQIKPPPPCQGVLPRGGFWLSREFQPFAVSWFRWFKEVTNSYQDGSRWFKVSYIGGAGLSGGSFFSFFRGAPPGPFLRFRFLRGFFSKDGFQSRSPFSFFTFNRFALPSQCF